MSRLSIEYRDLDSLVEADENPKGHKLAGIAASIRRLRVVESIGIIDGRTQKLVGGHGRSHALKLMLTAGEPAPVGIEAETYAVGDNDGLTRWIVPCTVGWSSIDDTEAKAAVISLNQHTIAGGWADTDTLGSILDELRVANYDAMMLGFDDWADAAGVSRTPSTEHDDNADDDDPAKTVDRGTLLSVLDITTGEPRHQVVRGEVWKVGRHTLFVCDVMRGHAQWVQALLDPGVLFCPYPGPFITLTEHARDSSLVLVQPDLYLAGHILDKHASVWGEQDLEQLAGP